MKQGSIHSRYIYGSSIMLCLRLWRYISVKNPDKSPLMLQGSEQKLKRVAKNSDLHFPPRTAPPIILKATPYFLWPQSEAQESSFSNPSADSLGASSEMPSEYNHLFPQLCYHPGLSHHHSTLGYGSQLLTSLPK